MKIPLSWLKEFISIEASVSQISEALTSLGIEVDHVESSNNETVFDISLTPNLGHCLSILGIARELSTYFQIPLQCPSSDAPEELPQKIEEVLDVAIEDRQQCLRYACRLVRNVKVGPSPEWMTRRLEQCGIRTINNVVDIGNYVMLELGQPLHLFDQGMIEGDRIFAASHTSFTSLLTLDEQMREIPPESLLICDIQKPLAFAGVMGGKHSGVTEKTESVVIEAAHFSPQSIRRSCKLLDVRSESSYRFERNIDPLGIPCALNRAIQLLSQLAGGNPLQGMIDRQTHPYHPTTITCRPSRVNALLGVPLSPGEIRNLLERLDMSITAESPESFSVKIPSYRNDLKKEVDLIEEVARLYGYENIPTTPAPSSPSSIGHTPIYLLERRVRELLRGESLQEWLTCDLISPSLATIAAEPKMGAKEAIHVLHPRSIDQSVLRSSLLPGLLQCLQYNLDRQNRDVAVFEVGKIHFKDASHFHEMASAGILLCGTSHPYHWDPKPRDVDFFDLKGKLENFIRSLRLPSPLFSPSHLHSFHPGRQSLIKVGEVIIGALGEVHPTHLKELGISARVFFAEINLHDLAPLFPKVHRMTPFSVYPGSIRDWTLTLNHSIPLSDIESAIHQVSSPHLERFWLMDLYQSETLGAHQKNITLRFVYRDPEKTIALETVEREHHKLMVEVAEKLGIH